MINVVWQDSSFDPKGEVWDKTSTNSGASFGGLQIISEIPASYIFPLSAIASSPTFVGVTWRGLTTTPGSSDVFFKPATVETYDVSFDQTEYESDLATITLSDSTLSGTQTVSLNSVPVDLPETSPGVFSSTVSLSANGGIPGQLFEVTFGPPPTFSAFAKIPTTSSVSFNPSHSPLNDGKIYGITVIDSTASGTVDVTISSPTNTAGVSVTLSETGVGTGIFSGTANIGFASTSFTPSAGDIVTITQVDTDGGTGAVDTKQRHISSTKFPT